MSYDALAVTIADIAAELPAEHVAAWADVLATVTALDRTASAAPDRSASAALDRSASATPDRLVEAALIDARPGYAIAGHVRRLLTAWRAEAPELPGPAVALALRSAAHLHQRATAERTELVISGPTSPSVPVRLTSSVVVGLIRAAQSSLLVVSFAAYGVTEVVTELVAAADRGVRIDVVLESSVGDGGALRGPSGASAAFAGLRDKATFWHWPAQRRAAAGNPRAALHAKLIAADGGTALISSANLTDRALSSNLEVGVVLHSPELVRRLVAHFAALMNPDNGPLMRR